MESFFYSDACGFGSSRFAAVARANHWLITDVRFMPSFWCHMLHIDPKKVRISNVIQRILFDFLERPGWSYSYCSGNNARWFDMVTSICWHLFVATKDSSNPCDNFLNHSCHFGNFVLYRCINHPKKCLRQVGNRIRRVRNKTTMDCCLTLLDFGYWIFHQEAYEKKTPSSKTRASTKRE